MALPDWVPDPTNHDTPPDNVPGGLAAREIRALKKRVTELTASMIADDSVIAAGTVKGALDELAQFVDAATGSINTLIDRLDELVASEVGNDSSVAGATVKDALDSLLSGGHSYAGPATFDPIDQSITLSSIEGFKLGDVIHIQGAALNDSYFTIYAIDSTAQKLIVNSNSLGKTQVQGALVAESVSSVTIQVAASKWTAAAGLGKYVVLIGRQLNTQYTDSPHGAILTLAASYAASVEDGVPYTLRVITTTNGIDREVARLASSVTVTGFPGVNHHVFPTPMVIPPCDSYRIISRRQDNDQPRTVTISSSWLTS